MKGTANDLGKESKPDIIKYRIRIEFESTFTVNRKE